MRFWAAVAMILGATALAADEPGEFDYYILALSWSPNWCALEGDARDAEQCDRDLGWSLHGLWPQNESGYPEDCRTAAQDPTRRESDSMADIMGSGALAWYQWKKHGRCSGLSGPDYYRLSRTAYDRVFRPEVLRQLDKTVTLPASVVEAAFLEANPGWQPDMLTVTCKDGRIQEVRICLTRNLDPRICGTDVRRDCQMTDALFSPIR